MKKHKNQYSKKIALFLFKNVYKKATYLNNFTI